MHNLGRVTGPSALATRAVAGAVILAGAIPPQMQAVGEGGNALERFEDSTDSGNKTKLNFSGRKTSSDTNGSISRSTYGKIPAPKKVPRKLRN